jgi:DNA-directed RNA polymerase subunit omega
MHLILVKPDPESGGGQIFLAKQISPAHVDTFHRIPSRKQEPNTVRDEYIKAAQKVIPDPNILINVVSRRVKQLKYGQKPLVESLERLTPEDTALREIIEGKITYELYEPEAEEA